MEISNKKCTIILKKWWPVFLILVLAIIIKFFIGNVKVVGHSMDPNLADRQRLVMSKKSGVRDQWYEKLRYNSHYILTVVYNNKRKEPRFPQLVFK